MVALTVEGERDIERARCLRNILLERASASN